MSSSMTLPKPWQVGHAPNGLLNENRRGCGVSYAMPQARHSKRSEKTSLSVFGLWALGSGLSALGSRALGSVLRIPAPESRSWLTTTANAAPPPSR